MARGRENHGELTAQSDTKQRNSRNKGANRGREEGKLERQWKVGTRDKQREGNITTSHFRQHLAETLTGFSYFPRIMILLPLCNLSRE